ncbi:MAG TPA: methyltransferase [Polyangia bacterium]|nr:methyltransferase [Polyangia bacterium]
MTFSRAQIDELLHRLFIDAPATSLRDEDRRKSDEMAGLLVEVERAVARRASESELVLVDAAAGKAYVGLLAAELVLAPRGRPARVRTIEQEPARAAACRDAILRLRAPSVVVEVVTADVADPAAWPGEPDLVVALHACGPASDAILDQSLAVRARTLLLVPCCTSKEVSAAALAQRRAEQLGVPRHAEVRRRFIQSIVDAERTLRLEAAGWQTTVVSFVAPTVTPHNLLWRAERVGEPGRMAEAADRLARLRGIG